MFWRDQRESDNVVDQRGMGGKVLGVGGLVVGAIIYTLMGGNPIDYLVQNADRVQVQQSSPRVSGGGNERTLDNDAKRFAAVVLADTEDVWHQIFEENQMHYREPKLVLFSQIVESACGRASSAVGPFYCPRDERVYLDLDFFNQLSHSLGAQGDFAQAYVIAHEVGHHVQNLLGIENKFRGGASSLSETRANAASVKIELQADCLAGIWAKRTEQTKRVIEQGDIDEAVNAAGAVGDDRLQKAAGREVVPDSFTHGTSAQRAAAFRLGFDDGDTQICLSSYRP